MSSRVLSISNMTTTFIVTSTPTFVQKNKVRHISTDNSTNPVHSCNFLCISHHLFPFALFFLPPANKVPYVVIHSAAHHKNSNLSIYLYFGAEI